MRSLSTLIFFTWYALSGIAQIALTDSLSKQLKPNISDEQRLFLLMELSVAHLELHTDSALYYAELAVELAESKESDLNLMQALRYKGDAIAATGDDSLAIAVYNRALQIKAKGDDITRGYIHRQLGVAHYHLANYDDAFNELISALEFFKADSLSEDRAGVLNNIGNVKYFTVMKEAAPYYSQSLAIHEKNGNRDGIASQLGNLGLVYINTQDFDKAIEYAERSLEIYSELGYQRSIARQQVNLAYAYKEAGKTSMALKYARLSLESRERLNDVRGVATSTIMLGNIYFKLDDYKEAIPYLKRGSEMARDLGMRSYEWESTYFLAECYKKVGEKDSALVLYPMVLALKDSIYASEMQTHVAEAETRYQTLQKEGEIALLTREAEISDLKLRRSEIYLGTAAIITFLLGIISLIIYFFYRVKSRANAVLENKNNEISAQKLEIEEINEHITDSIRYAERLQAAILPKDETFAKHFSDFHILYKPKDIVSGDFYWMEEEQGLLFLAVADCTGHGVPGAMVSMVGFQGLNKAVVEEGLKSPAAILQRLSDHVEEAFEKSGGSVKDGMDICLCVIDKKKRVITYAGAHNSLWVLSNQSDIPNAILKETVDRKSLFEFKADRRSIGGYFDAGPFTEKVFSLQQGDRLFLFSDGFADQFGGPNDKKFGSKRMRQTFMEAASKGNLIEIDTAFAEWKADSLQIDDVSVISVVV